ncbi:MAG: class I SAM-dependent rRNA methyltransferase, partial [Bacteroidales bacterium]|nr:class I SAM-dependent rRNA methyltransferase [Bacteroidales bacterium]
MVKIILKRGRDESIRRFHPWVFSGAIAQILGAPAEGDLVAVHDSEGRYLASGHYQIGSIAVRILSFSGDPQSPSFWADAISDALKARKAIGLPSADTNCFRLIHGEGDGLPGLIIDWYDGVCVMQAHSAGMFRAKNRICEALRLVFGDRLKAVYDKSSGTAPFKAGLDLVDGYIYKAPGFEEGERIVSENGCRFIVNWVEGQKTGFFLDQRDNRAIVGKYACGKRVLNLFCYTGGFSLYALRGGALSVDSVDSSAKAMALVDRNVSLNAFAGEHRSLCCDAIEYLGQCEEGRYDMMIVDPPAF